MRRYFRILSSVCLLSIPLLCSCDPQKDALNLFTQQGLTVLKPARSYIALGGIFVLPKHGTPEYLDPYDSLPGTDPNPFNAVVMQQSSNNAVGLAAAVGTLGGLVTIPAGLKFSYSKQVQLAQIDTSGTRYTSQMVAALIQKPQTSSAIQSQLTGGNRVFIVQEIYTGKSLSLKSSDSTGLAAAIEGAASIPSCSSTTSASTTPAKTTPGATTPGATTPGATTPAKGKASTTKPTATTGGGTAGAAGSTNVGISVGACWSDAATLSFQSTTAIPFAVRLNEVVDGPGQTLQIKVTGFKLPNTALGNEDVAATVLINANDPTLTGTHKRSHSVH
jgi:hypothetical protein